MAQEVERLPSTWEAIASISRTEHSENKGAVITCKKSKREEQRWCHLHGWLPLLCLNVTEPDVSGVPGVRPILKFFRSFLCDITGEGRTTLKDKAVFKEESSIAPFRMKDVQGLTIPGKTAFTIRTNLGPIYSVLNHCRLSVQTPTSPGLQRWHPHPDGLATITSLSKT